MLAFNVKEIESVFDERRQLESTEQHRAEDDISIVEDIMESLLISVRARAQDGVSLTEYGLNRMPRKEPNLYTNNSKSNLSD